MNTRAFGFAGGCDRKRIHLSPWTIRFTLNSIVRMCVLFRDPEIVSETLSRSTWPLRDSGWTRYTPRRRHGNSGPTGP